jgi:hypothetical protein
MNIDDIIEKPMGDDEIKRYLPSANILKYSDLERYNDILELLPNKIDYFILLYQDSENTGHWCAVLRYNNIIEFFDPYGTKSPDNELTWVSCNVRRELGTDIPYLSRMFNKAKQKIIYNTYHYQKYDKDINTCGRHCTFRVMCLLNYGLTLKDYYKYMRQLKKQYKMSYDEMIATLINQ